MNQIRVRDEVPNTEQGLKLYVMYCERAIKENTLHNRRLKTRLEWARDKLAKFEEEQCEDPIGSPDFQV